MKDLNFFEFYIEAKEFSINKQLILFSIIILLTICISFYSVFNEIKIKQISKEVDKLRLTANDERINKKVNELIGKKEEVKEFEKNLIDLKDLDKKIEDSRVIDYYFLDIINSKMYNGMFFTSFTVNTDNIEIIGIAENEKLVADFAKNINSIEIFDEIFISNISKKDEYYNFNLNINLKDVTIGEGDGSFEENEIHEDKDAQDEFDEE